MAYDLSGNTELKNETFNIIQKPKIKFYWKDGKPEETDRTRFLKSASGSIEMQNIDREATKNTFDITLENTDNDPTSPGTWFPENSLSNGETVRIELGYEHAGAGAETITMSRGIVRQLTGTTDTKSSTLSALDNGKDFDKEITINTFFKNKKPYELITAICSEFGYLTTNPVGSKKLVIRSKVSAAADESILDIKYYAITEQFGWDVINEICETSLGRFFINRSGDAEYWTYEYWADKFSVDTVTVDFVGALEKNPGDELLPILSQNIDCSYGNMINSTEVNYQLFITRENFDGDQFTFELASGEEETFEINVSGFYETLDTNYNLNWTKEGFLDQDYQGTTYGVDLDIINVVNNYNKLFVTIKNNNANYLYCFINPRVILGYSYKSKTVKFKESDALFLDGTANFEKNKETKKTINSLLIQNKNWANNIGYRYIDLYRYPTRQCVIKTTGFPQIDLGDTIQVWNLIETKNQELIGWVKKIDWDYSLDDGFLMTLTLDVISSNILTFTTAIEDLFDDNTKTYSGSLTEHMSYENDSLGTTKGGNLLTIIG